MKKYIRFTLKNYFPTWTDTQVGGLTRFVSTRFKNVELDIIFDSLHKSIDTFQKKYPKDQNKPQLLAEVVKNDVLKKLKKNPKSKLSQYRKELEKDFEKNWESEFGSFNQLSSLQKVNEFCRLVKKQGIFSKKQEEFFDAMSQAALTVQQNPTNSKWKKLFWEEVKQILHNSGIEIGDNYFSQLKNRVITQLKQEVPVQGREALQLVVKEKEVTEKLVRLFNPFPEYLSTAYRFSVEELEKMIWLRKEIFGNYEYSFNPNRFPEVYYCDVKEIHTRLPEHPRDDQMTIDYLGLYFDFFQSFVGISRNDYLGGRSQEGKIVLFKDRIEAYCKRTRFTEDDVRFVVLMHELGHWMSHWAISSEIHWEHGYHVQQSPSFTHEALAQLIAYWCCKGNPTHEEILLALSPKNGAGNIDASKPYGAYESLKNFEEEVILQKLDQLRKFWMITDLQMLAFLQSDLVNMAQWIRESKKKANGPVWEEFVDKELGEWLNYAVFINGWGNQEVYDTLEIGEDYLKKFKDTIGALWF